MFAACSHRYLELNPPPNPSAWAGEADPPRRARRALEDLYGFFGRTSPMFEKIYRDVGEFESLKKIMDRFDAYLRNLADELAAAWHPNRAAARRQAILRHAVKFATWQSFTLDGVGDEQKIELIIQWLSG